MCALGVGGVREEHRDCGDDSDGGDRSAAVVVAYPCPLITCATPHSNRQLTTRARTTLNATQMHERLRRQAVVKHVEKCDADVGALTKRVEKIENDKRGQSRCRSLCRSPSFPPFLSPCPLYSRRGWCRNPYLPLVL
jgi:hypothetical protein